MINRRIKAWENVRLIFMPGLSDSLTADTEDTYDDDSSLLCWEKDLHLPSSFDLRIAQSICTSGLIEMRNHLDMHKRRMH